MADFGSYRPNRLFLHANQFSKGGYVNWQPHRPGDIVFNVFRPKCMHYPVLLPGENLRWNIIEVFCPISAKVL
jgi:hypothetical protein